MAITSINVSSPSNEILFTDTAMGVTIDAIKSSSAIVYFVQVNNSANASAVYVKLYNLASGSVSVGTTPPDECIFVPGLATVTHQLLTGGAAGKTFATALSAACVTTGGTAGVVAPSTSVAVTISYQ